jgi:hypothetical protein
MTTLIPHPLRAGALALVMGLSSLLAQAADALPSWNEGATKARIVAFVQAVTESGGKDFVPPAERIAVFDNDGTLWSEQPVYFQAMFVRDRVIALAPKNPAWKTQQPFASLIKGDMKAVAASGEKGMAALMAATHAGMTTA